MKKRTKRLLFTIGISTLVGLCLNDIPSPIRIEQRTVKTAPKPLEAKDLLERLRDYAKVTPLTPIDQNKPFFFYIGQNHQDFSNQYTTESINSQIDMSNCSEQLPPVSARPFGDASLSL